ncbi:MAG: elongation factor G [Oscillospiraceae bacterium]|nr:elongation factor G [Oscillospiraceae bacterium]
MKNIRNICLIGHGGNGKTTLAESMLFVTGAIDRMGKVADGNTVCDYDPEETKRQISISSALAPVNYGGCKINVIDCPGFFDFAGEVEAAMRVADAAVIVCSAKDGITVGTERAWKAAKKANKPVMFYISKLDEENGSYDNVLAALQEKFGSTVCAVNAPAASGNGVVDIVNGTVYTSNGNKVAKAAASGADADKAAELRESLMETAAGADEELMEKYFDAMELTNEETAKGIKLGMIDRSVMPVVCGCATKCVGTEALLQAIVDYAPCHEDMPALECTEGEIKNDPNGPVVAYVFKTISDQFGKYSFVKVLSGKLGADSAVHNTRTGSHDKLGRLYTMCGKKNIEVKEALCGDIVAIGKMEWKTGDTVCEGKNDITVAPIDIAEPCYSMAIAPKTKGQDDKVATGLARLNEEDISFTITNNAETHQMVLAGAGDMQLDVLCSKLKARFAVDTELFPARVPYREKIKAKVEAHGRHKKQSGGSGQFGDVWIRFEPQEESDEMIFAEEVFGGSVPKNYFPSVEKGLRNAVNKGVLAGYPLVGLKATLYDGSYHPVDSNDMAFQTAARLAYQEGIAKAKPTIMEPIALLKVTIPDANLGDIMSDISSKRRGTVLGMNAEDGMQTVEAEVPMSEMSSYTIDLRSMTQGRGFFTMKFVRYEEAPANVQQKVIEEAKALAEAE